MGNFIAMYWEFFCFGGWDYMERSLLAYLAFPGHACKLAGRVATHSWLVGNTGI